MKVLLNPFLFSPLRNKLKRGTMVDLEEEYTSNWESREGHAGSGYVRVILPSGFSNAWRCLRRINYHHVLYCFCISSSDSLLSASWNTSCLARFNCCYGLCLCLLWYYCRQLVVNQCYPTGLDKFSSLWSRQNLMQTVVALIHKQTAKKHKEFSLHSRLIWWRFVVHRHCQIILKGCFVVIKVDSPKKI